MVFEEFYTKGLKPIAKTKMTDDWNERVVQAVEEWFTVKMHEAMKARKQSGVDNVFSLTDSIRLLMQEAPGVEAFFIKNGADVFLKDEVEIIVGWETEEEVQTRLNDISSFSELNNAYRN